MVLKLVTAEYAAQQAAPMPEFQHRGLSLRELREWFLRDYAQPLELSTKRNYERALVLACDGKAKTKRNGQVDPLPEHPTPRDVAAWLSRLATAGYASTTIHLHRTSLVHVFEAGSTCGKTWGNPFAVVPWRKEVPKRAPLHDVRGTWAFLAASDLLTLRERALVAVLRFTGLRKGEALGLEWRHVDFKAGRLHVDQQRRKANSRRVSRKLKSEAARRWVPMRAELADTLRELRREGLTHEVRCGLGGGKREVTPLLFPFGEHQLTRILAVLRGIDAGFPVGDAWHVFRHTCAVELWRAGKSEAFIQEWLGHASLEKTAVYLRSLDGRRISPAEVAGLDPDYVPREVTGARAMKLAAHDAREKKETVGRDAARTTVPVLTEVAPSVVVAVPPAVPVEERRMKPNTVEVSEAAATTTATAAGSDASLAELRMLGAQATELEPSSSLKSSSSLSSSSAGVRGSGGDSKLTEPVEKCELSPTLKAPCWGCACATCIRCWSRQRPPNRGPLPPRGGRSEAEAVAHSEVANEARCECGAEETSRARCNECGCEDFEMCDGCGKVLVVSAPPNCACVGAVAVSKVEAPPSLPFVTPAEDAANEEAQAAQRTRDFCKAELVALARRGESLAVALGAVDADHAEEVLGFLGALTDSMEQGPGAVVPMVTVRLRKLRAEWGTLKRGAERLAAEEAKATARALGAEAQVQAARLTNDQLTESLKRVTHERDAARSGLERTSAQLTLAGADRATLLEQLSEANERLNLWRELLEWVRDSGRRSGPPKELWERIEKAVRS